MNWEWKKQSRNGKRFINIGFGMMDAVGTEHPASDIPMGEGVRLFITKAIDRWWTVILAGAALHRFRRRRRKKKL